MEFSVPARVQNLELSVPTHLVLIVLLDSSVSPDKKKVNGGILLTFCEVLLVLNSLNSRCDHCLGVGGLSKNIPTPVLQRVGILSNSKKLFL